MFLDRDEAQQAGIRQAAAGERRRVGRRMQRTCAVGRAAAEQRKQRKQQDRAQATRRGVTR